MTEDYLSRDQMQERRMRAAQLLRDGTQQVLVARLMSVSKTSVARWNEVLKSKGLKGLEKRRAGGRPSRLTQAQKDRLVRILKQDPDKVGFFGKDNLWTSGRIAAVIESRFGVVYDKDHALRLSKKLYPKIHSKRIREEGFTVESALSTPETATTLSGVSSTHM